MADLAVDIVSRTNQVKRDLKEVSVLADNLGKEFIQAGQAAETMDKSMAKLNTAGNKSKIIWFQAGQAISDFAAAGVLGAANNIQFLAAQIGIGGPLIGAIAVASTALIVFGDDIKAVFSEVSVDLDQLKKDVKGVADELVKVKDGLKVTFEGTTDELEADSKRIGQIIEALQKRATDLRFQLGQQQTQQVGGVTTFISSSPEITRLKGELENVLSVLSRQQGIQESINETVKEQRLLEQVIADLGETTLTKEEKARREKLTLLQRTQQANERLKEQLEALRNADQSRLGTLLLQNKSLQEQIKIAQRLAQERARLGGGLGIGGLSGVGAGGFATGAEPIQDIVKRIKEQNRQIIPGSFLRGAGGEDLADSDKMLKALEGIADGTDRTAEAFDRAGLSAQYFFTQTREGAQVLGTSVASLAGGIGSAFEAAYDAAGQKAGDFFVAFKAFSIAEATISAFVAANKALAELGPIAGPIAAAAIYAQAIGNVIAIASIKPGSGAGAGVSGGGSIGRTGSGFVDPRQGRTGRLQREDDVVNQFGFAPGRLRKGPVNIGYDPLAPMEVTIGGGFNLKLLGEDLVGSWEKTMQRQERTRGPKRDATRNSTGYRGGR